MNDSVIIIESACTRDGALTYLEIEEYKEHNNRRQQARNTRCVTTEEGVRQGRDLVRFCQQGVEQGDHTTFVLSVLFSLDSTERESFPEDALADVSANEEGDTISETVAFL